MARRTARRSSASSPRVELTKTRRRWSGVRIRASLGKCPSTMRTQIVPPRLVSGRMVAAHSFECTWIAEACLVKKRELRRSPAGHPRLDPGFERFDELLVREG